MLRKIVKTITNNFGLKVLAVLFAVVLWLVVVNIDDPNHSPGNKNKVHLVLISS